VALSASGHRVLRSHIPWTDRKAVRSALAEGIDALRRSTAGQPWSVAWCAGAGVVSTPPEDLEAEIETFAGFVNDLARLGAGGTVFLASSAGGVYAGSPDASPYTEHSTTRSLSSYGEAKLAMERIAVDFATATGTKLLVGRLSNLYGPGQNLAKPQGLVSMLCQAQISRQPVGVYVSLDTLRDYLFVEDAARVVAAGLDRLAAQDQLVITKIMSSGRGVSVAMLVGEATRVFRRRPPIVFRGSAASRAQVRDLRFRSVVWPQLDRLVNTALPVGLAATGRSLAETAARTSIAGVSAGGRAFG
jgi:UDP-glucose 4-epimerase